MSINVTVNGNPVSINRGRMVLTDLDEIKKNERDRRRKLRLEQVREQSKQISNRLLERAKNVTKAQLTQLEKDGRSELRQIHDQKIMNLQRKYQEDMEDIGRAHASASIQPDVQAFIETEKKKNRFVALERGKEALQRLKESNQTENENGATLHERQRQVREMENARAFMVANLPKRSSAEKQSTDQDSDSESENRIRKSTKKKRERKGNNKLHKSVQKVVVESPNVQIVVSEPKAKRSGRDPGPSRIGIRKTETTADSKRSYGSSKTITDISEFPSVGVSADSDNQEPRKSLPKFNSPSKADRLASYNPEDYKPDSSSSGSSSNGSTSLSDDSSYFSDGVADSSLFLKKKTPRHTTSAASSKVQLYDHNTRQRNAYEKPFGIVERIKIDNEPNAEELAHAVTESENADSNLVANRRREAARRGNDAILRDRVRRDYKNLLENLDHLSREERKLKASQIHGPLIKDIHLNPVRRKELLARRQRDMDYAFESNLPDRNEEDEEEFLIPSKRVVTIPVNEDKKEEEEEGVWNDSQFFEPSSNVLIDEDESVVDKNDREISRNEQILEMLRKVERQKRLLLKEFGADLPDDVFTASVKPLFSNDVRKKVNGVKNKLKKLPTDDIKVINMSSCEDNNNEKVKIVKNNVKSSGKKIEIAVQTSAIEDEKSVAFDKSVQVELINGNRKEKIFSNSTSEEMIDDKKSYDDDNDDVDIESNSVSSDSVETTTTTGIVIDIKKKRVKLTPRKKRSSIKISRGNSPRVVAKPRSVSGVKLSTPVKRQSKSAPSSKQSTPRSKETDSKPIRIKDKKVKIELDKGNIKVKINPKLNEDSYYREASTESSKSVSTDVSRDKTMPPTSPVSKNQIIKPRDTSDTSTSYTSPPPPTPASYRSVRDNSTPILEILESSKGGEAILKKRDISPVSSPGTPSPRTINLPTNTPHSRHINRVLEYFDSTISQSTDNTISISLPGRQSTPNEIPNFVKNNRGNFSDKSLDICLCKNPGCKLTHLNMREVDNETLKNYPEILLKYQDLKSMCTDRIASLTDLIEKVRNDKKGIELSVGGNASEDESSIFLLPGSTPGIPDGDLYSVRKLVDSIEAVHNQLAKTIDQSQRIIGVKKLPKRSNNSPSKNLSTGSNGRDENSPINRNDAKSSSVNESNDKELTSRILPRVISSEIVNVPLSQFNIMPKEKKPISPDYEKKKNINNLKTLQEEDVVERLSKEILEQSKTFDNIVPETIYSTKINQSNDTSESSSFSPRRKSPTSLKKQRDDGSEDFENKPGERNGNSFSPSGTKTEKDADFVPLLAGIPKVQRMLPNISDNRRPRPPVTLIHGSRSVQTGSPGHELSTIVEFDTPDTAASKSQKSIRSPTTKITDEKSRKNLTKNYETSMIQAENSGKPENRNPLDSSKKFGDPTTLTPESVDKISESSSARKRNNKVDKLKERIFRDAGTSSGYCDSERDCGLESCRRKSVDKKPIENLSEKKDIEDNSVSNKEIYSDSSCSIPDISAEFTKRNLLFHARMITATETTNTPFRGIKDSRNRQEAIKSPSNDAAENDKIITSTSSNSFSALSGISEITSTPTSDILKYTSSPEEMETALKKLGLGWAITTLKKTREASALSSSSNSDTTPIMQQQQQSRKLISSSTSPPPPPPPPPTSKKDIESKINCLTNLSDVSSISIKNANKSTERAILLKARTSTPNIENSNSSCEKNSSSTTNSSSRLSIQDQSDSLTAPNLSLVVANKKSQNFDKQLNGP